MQHLTQPSRQQRDSEADACQRIYDLVGEWERGMPLSTVRTVTTGAERNVAARWTPFGHAMHDRLMAFFDALIAEAERNGAYVRTLQGCINRADLAEAEAWITGEVIRLPVQHPWIDKPSDGRAGVRGAAIYRAIPVRDAPPEQAGGDEWFLSDAADG